MIKNGHGIEISVSVSADSEGSSGFALPVDPEKSVTPRQLELLALYASGYRYEHIARVKFLSPYTVRRHMALAVARSGARNLTHLCSALVEAGMIRRNAENIYEPVAPDLRIVG
jgi:DNA-binding NarL/FixJ family response regulator